MATQSKVRLKVGVDEARQAILDALPKDTIVREDDDGIGRFAGARTLVIIGKGRERLLLFHGSYGDIKRRADNPDLDVVFDTSGGRVVAKLIRQEAKPPSALSRAFDVLGNIVTVGLVVIAYHMIRAIPWDNQQVALVAVGGGIGWAAIAHFMPKRADTSLLDVVDKALKPLAAPKKKKAKPEAPAEPEAKAPAAPEAKDA